MTREEFYENTKRYILGMLPGAYASYSVRLLDCRNQRGNYKGMVLQPPEDLDPKPICPMINLDRMYEEYGDLEPMEGLLNMSSMIEQLLTLQPKEQFGDLLKWVGNFEEAKKRLVIAPMSLARRSDLTNSCYVSKEGIYLQACLLVEQTEESTVSIEVTPQLLQMWDVSFETVYETADKNTERMFPLEIDKINDLVSQLFAEEINAYVVHHKKGSNGAALIFAGDNMARVAKEVGGSFMLLPSSVDEVIILSLDGMELTKQEILEQEENVRSINQEYVDPGYRLSDEVYVYNAEEGVFLEGKAYAN